MTSNLSLDLSIRELFDFLKLSNKFLEIGREFGGDDDYNNNNSHDDKSSLLRYLASEMS